MTKITTPDLDLNFNSSIVERKRIFFFKN